MYLYSVYSARLHQSARTYYTRPKTISIRPKYNLILLFIQYFIIHILFRRKIFLRKFTTAECGVLRQ